MIRIHRIDVRTGAWCGREVTRPQFYDPQWHCQCGMGWTLNQVAMMTASEWKRTFWEGDPDRKVLVWKRDAGPNHVAYTTWVDAWEADRYEPVVTVLGG